VTWVMFDYGCVVSYPPTQQDMALLAEVAGAGVADLVEAYWYWRRAYDLAELDAAGYWRQVGAGLGRSYGDAEISELTRMDRAAWLRLQTGTVALIEDLAAAGQPLAMLSNAPDELAEAIIGLPVAAHFGHLIFSCQLKSAKPDPECYVQALARMGARADQVIFVDDRSENVAAAAALGLHSVQFIGASRARADIAERLAACG
jgi:putative hydrolase of the HAD superfamily